MYFEIVSAIVDIEVVAVGRKIREISRLRKKYGSGRWRKLKGTAKVRLGGDKMFRAEVHWYEAHGVGRCEFKIKRILD